MAIEWFEYYAKGQPTDEGYKLMHTQNFNNFPSIGQFFFSLTIFTLTTEEQGSEKVVKRFEGGTLENLKFQKIKWIFLCVLKIKFYKFPIYSPHP